MSSFIFEKQHFHSPAGLTLKLLHGKWKFEIIEALAGGKLRYKDIQTRLSTATPRILSLQLKSLIADGFVVKEVVTLIPAVFEYGLTEKGILIIPIIEKMNEFGLTIIKSENTKLRLKL